MNITVVGKDIKVTHDTGGDFTLPDYLPPVSRLLRAECSIIPEGVYLKEGSSGVTAQFGGTAIYTVMWADSDGVPWSTTLESNYESAVVIGQTAPARCMVDTKTENVYCRVVAPRKLSLRSRLVSRILTLAEEETTPDSDGGTYEMQEQEETTVRFYRGLGQDLQATYTEEATIGEDGSPIRPVFCAATVVVNECRQTGGTIRARGDIILVCVYDGADGLYETTKRIPFDELIDLDGMPETDNLQCRVTGTITSLNITADENGIRADIIYDLYAEAAENLPVPITSDAYSCTIPSVCTYRDASFLRSVCCFTGNVSVNERSACDTSSDDGNVCAISASAIIEEAEAQRGKVILTGKCNGNALVTDSEGLSNVQFSVPWRYEVSAPDVSPGDSLIVWGGANVTSSSGRIDKSRGRDDRLCLDLELSVSATIFSEKNKRILASVKVDGDKPLPKSSKMTVYYPDPDETLWDVAKRFHVPVSVAASGGNTTPDGKPNRVMVI